MGCGRLQNIFASVQGIGLGLRERSCHEYFNLLCSLEGAGDATDRNFKACFPRGAQPVVPTRDARHERPLVGSTTAPYAPRGASDVFMTMSAGHRRFAPGSFTGYSDNLDLPC